VEIKGIKHTWNVDIYSKPGGTAPFVKPLKFRIFYRYSEIMEDRTIAYFEITDAEGDTVIDGYIGARALKTRQLLLDIANASC
jgi:hypothetical protein